MNNNKTTEVITPMVTEPHANRSNSRSSIKVAINKQIRNFKIECRHAWQNKDIRKLWDYAMHMVGFLSYAAICLLMALIFSVVFITSSITTRGRKKHGDDEINILMKLLEDILVGLYRVMASMFGWPDINHKIYRIPLVILNTIVAKVRPNRVTQFFGYGTLMFGGYLLVTNFDYFIYRFQVLFGQQPQY